MSLILCPECKRMISNTAQSCPKCGFVISAESIEQRKIDHPKLGDIINCPRCAKLISKYSKVCKHCQLDMSPEGLEKYALEHPKLTASVNCPKCNKRISKSSKVCMYCNTEISYEEMHKLEKKATKKLTIGCSIAVVAFIIICIVVSIIEPDKHSSSKPTIQNTPIENKKPTAEDGAIAFKKLVINRDPKGSVWQVETWLEDNVNDPKSLEYLEWGPVQKTKLGNYSVVLKYRGKNAFGALVIQQTVFFLNNEGDVIRTESLE